MKINRLKGNLDNRWVRHALEKIELLYESAGPHVEAFRLRGLSPRERANAAWARIRKAQIDPQRIVAAWLSIEMAVAVDPYPETKGEFKCVQAAKVVHRMASGTHKRWGDGASVKELHVFPRSRGRVLRYIGADIASAMEFLIEKLPSLADLD